MAPRNVRRRAKKILSGEPTALVWCEINKDIPKPPREIHEAAGRPRLKPGNHWMFYVLMAVFCVVVVPYILLDSLAQKLDRPGSRDPESRTPRSRGFRSWFRNSRASDQRPPGHHVFDGDWDLTAGRLVLNWYAQSPNSRRLVLLTEDRLCLAASPRRRLSHSGADDFELVAEFPRHQAPIETNPGQPRDSATFRITFTDGSWLKLSNLATPEDADHFLRTAAES